MNPIRGIQLTLNQNPMLGNDVYLERIQQLPKLKEPGLNPVRIRQTPLQLLHTFELSRPARETVLQSTRDRLRFLLRDSSKTVVFETDRLEPSRVLFWRESDEPLSPASQYPFRGAVTLERHSRHDRSVLEVYGPGGRGRSQPLSRYFCRPWFDGGSMAGRFFAQLDSDGHKLFLYHRSPTTEAEPELRFRQEEDLQAAAGV